MHSLDFIQDLAVLMLAAGFISILFHRLNQPVVLGYILAGIIIGPHTPPFSFISNQENIQTLAQLGVVFLMFSLGLEFSFRDLQKVGAAVSVIAIGEIIVMLWLGYEIGKAFHWRMVDALFLGGILAISSTTIIVKALKELDLEKKDFSQLIYGILIVEDLLGIAIIAVLSGIAKSGSVGFNDVLLTMGKLILFLIITTLIGLYTIPKILRYVAVFHSRETLLITMLSLCFGFCLLVIKMEYSIALGAFLIGAIMAESRHEVKIIRQLTAPVRDMFSAIFFVSVGLLLDPAVVMEHTLAIIVITIAVVLGKVITCSLGSLLVGKDGKTSLRVGMGMAQIGEFSFIIAGLGLTLNVTSSFIYPIAVAVSVMTTFLTPYFIRSADPLANCIAKKLPRSTISFFEKYRDRIQHKVK